jgi:hypothetical protein
MHQATLLLSSSLAIRQDWDFLLFLWKNKKDTHLYSSNTDEYLRGGYISLRRCSLAFFARKKTK